MALHTAKDFPVDTPMMSIDKQSLNSMDTMRMQQRILPAPKQVAHSKA